MSSSNQISDLDATIAHAVNARVEAEVMKALSGDEVIGQYVSAALQSEVEVNKRSGYGKERRPFLSVTIDNAVRNACKDAIAKVIVEEVGVIEDEVRKAVRRDAAKIAEKFAEGLVDASASGYRFRIELPGNL